MSGAVRAFAMGLLCVGLAGPAAALVYQVNAAAACPGSGTALAPYCAIGSAAAIAAPGDTVNVAAGVYREQVTPASSGSAGLPITYHGAAGAKLYGTNNLSGAALWALSGGTTYATPYNPPTNPAQVFIDGVAQTASTAGAGAVPVNGFFYDGVADVLYVNLGLDNPGLHDVEAGARSFGFSVDTKSYLVIEGFEVRGQNTNGMRVRSSANVVVRGNRVLRSASFGLVADGTTAPTTTGPIEISGNELFDNNGAGLRLRTNVVQATVANNVAHHNRSHGFLISDTTASVFSGNTLYANSNPTSVSITGLLMEGNSDGNRIERNLAYENQDSGFQLSGSSTASNDPDGNLLVRNISYVNGDHGFDVRECDAPQLISNTSSGNFNDGFSIEGHVTNAFVRNNIAAENSLFTGGNELWVDATSTAGFSSDYNVFWRSKGSGTVEYGGAVYATLADFAAATPHEDHGVGANPNFVNPAAGDFHPGMSPALDASDASVAGFQAPDFAGMAPIDLAGVANTGAGVPNFADRGALERLDAAPVARLTVTPKRQKIGLPVTANGSASSDDTGIVTYHFGWGDGTFTTQTGPVATHVYRTTGTKKVQLTVTDQAGQASTTQKVVQIVR